jgi:hypothetical protein
MSPLGGYYRYKRLVDASGEPRSFIAVDPGQDKLLGLDANCDPDNSDGDSDGTTDDKDNIYSDDRKQ